MFNKKTINLIKLIQIFVFISIVILAIVIIFFLIFLILRLYLFFKIYFYYTNLYVLSGYIEGVFCGTSPLENVWYQPNYLMYRRVVRIKGWYYVICLLLTCDIGGWQ